MSQIEWKTIEIRGFKKLANFPPFSCPGDLGLVDGDPADSLLCGVVSLVLETRAFDALCGAPLPDGGRGAGALDAHLPRKDVDAVLARAGKG